MLHVSSGLYDVDLEARTVQPVYWTGPSHSVVRGFWFVLNHTGKWMPVNEATAGFLETAYQHRVWEKESPMQINVGEGLTASFYSEGDVWLHEKNVVNLLSQIGFGLRPGYRLSRGYPNVAELGGGEVGLHAGGAQGSGDEIEHVVCSLSLSLLQGEYFRDPL